MLQHKCGGEKTISRVLSLLPLCWLQEPNPGPWDWQQVPSQCEPVIKKILKPAFLQRKTACSLEDGNESFQSLSSVRSANIEALPPPILTNNTHSRRPWSEVRKRRLHLQYTEPKQGICWINVQIYIFSLRNNFISKWKTQPGGASALRKQRQKIELRVRLWCLLTSRAARSPWRPIWKKSI